MGNLLNDNNKDSNTYTVIIKQLLLNNYISI
jgi:hypothetical protein